MKRTGLVSLLLALGLLVPGCPIYGSDAGCTYDSDCQESYFCDSADHLCRPVSDKVCKSPSECMGSETCSRAGYCLLGDCSWPDIGCVAGFECSAASGTWACVPEGSGSGESGGAGGQAGSGSSSGGTSVSGGSGAI